MSKLDIAPVQAGYRSAEALTQNFEAIEAVIENTLSRDGTSPNHMEADLDLNGNRILNLPEPVEPTEAVRLQDVSSYLATYEDLLADTEEARNEAVAAAATASGHAATASGAATTATNAAAAAATAETNAEAAADRAEAATPGFIVVEGHEEYDPAWPYDRNNIVTSDSLRFYSLIDDNLGNDPATSPESWAAYDFALTHYSEALTVNIPTGGGFGDDGTLGVELQNADVTAGYLDWSAANPFRVRNAADDTTLLNLTSSGLLTVPAISCSGALTTGGVITAIAAGRPLIVNSTDSTGQKIELQDNGTARGRWGASSTNVATFRDESDVLHLAVPKISGAVDYLQLRAGAAGTVTMVPAGASSAISVAIQQKDAALGQVLLGLGSELRVNNARVLASVPIQFPSYTVATLPAATTAARMIYVSNETGGAVMAFSDGTNWRRVTDRAIVS